MERERIVIRRHGGPKVLVPEREDMGPVPDGHVRIDVAYSGVNWADIMMRLGMYPEAPKPPFTPGYEVSGKVLEVGDNVPGDLRGALRKGRKVAAGTRFGGYASHVDVPAADVVALPRPIPLDHAAAMPVNYLTAWAALVGHGRVQEGDKVLVHGGAGGVGLAAIGLAKRHGADVYAMVGSAGKARLLEDDYGVVKAWDRHALGDDWATKVRDDAGRMDLVLDPVGGRHLHESRRTLRPFGSVIAYGLQDSVSGGKRRILKTLDALRHMRVKVIPLMHRNTSVSGINMLPLQNDPDVDLGAAMESMARDMVRGNLAPPRIHATFPLAEAGAAHGELSARRNIGKVLLDCA